MKKQLKNTLLLFVTVVAMSILMYSCKPSDADVKTAVETALKTNPDLQSVVVDVKDGIATLTGEVKTDAAKSAVDSLLKDIKGLSSITNNLTVTPPAPVISAADQTLIQNLVAAIKDEPTVKADVKNGIVTLTGEIKKARLPKLLQKISALKPAKITNQLTVK